MPLTFPAAGHLNGRMLFKRSRTSLSCDSNSHRSPSLAAWIALSAITAWLVILCRLNLHAATIAPLLDQSPIHIRSQDTVFSNTLPALQFDYVNCLGCGLTNSGAPDFEETIRLYAKQGVPGSPGTGTLTVGGTKYYLQEFHFHSPSEHMINGVRYPMELHMVHTNANGDYLVVGRMIQAGAGNGFATLFNNLPQQANTGTNIDFDLNSLVPAGPSYPSYRYTGSLTAHKFYIVVSWIMLNEPLKLDPSQIAAFQRLFPAGNTRGVQPINGRVIVTDVPDFAFPVAGTSGPWGNAWQINGNGMKALTYNYTNTASEKLSANGGWTYTVVCRLTQPTDLPGGQMMLYGTGSSRFGVEWGTDSAGRLIGTPLSTPSVVTNIVLTTNAADATNYHTHQFVFDPATASAIYYFDGMPVSTNNGDHTSNHNGAVLWGYNRSGSGGAMNYHSVKFVPSSGIPTCEYDAGFRLAPLVAPTAPWVLTLPSGSPTATESQVLADPLPLPSSPILMTVNDAISPLITSGNYLPVGKSVTFNLTFDPAPGAEITVIRNTGTDFIPGTFDNLVQGETVTLNHGGIDYDFVANYFGGSSGRDLVLSWAKSTLVWWGYNYVGGDSGSTPTVIHYPFEIWTPSLEVPVIAASMSTFNSVVVTADGTVSAWGDNSYGQLGNHSSSQPSDTPVSVNIEKGISDLWGKTVVAVALGKTHSLALCTDGTLVAWGDNSNGQLGIGSWESQKILPRAVNTGAGSALQGKRVVAIAAGISHSLALLSDGSMAAWGLSSIGAQIIVSTNIPVLVDTSAFPGKRFVAIAAGGYHNLALSADGVIVAWGDNSYGQLGQNSVSSWVTLPAAVNTTPGLSDLAGKTPSSIAAGLYFSAAVCTDGSVVAWGENGLGQLGDNSLTQRLVPHLVNTTDPKSALLDKRVTRIAAGNDFCVAQTVDGITVAWGNNQYGQLGSTPDGPGTNSVLPRAVEGVGSGSLFGAVFAGSGSLQAQALIAAPTAAAHKEISGSYSWSHAPQPQTMAVRDQGDHVALNATGEPNKRWSIQWNDELKADGWRTIRVVATDNTGRLEHRLRKADLISEKHDARRFFRFVRR